MQSHTALRSAIALSAFFACSTAAQAQLFRAYLASDGSDANPCTLAAPCRLLPAALAAVTSSGEIWMLDSANYNSATVTIGKSVSILAVPGAVGSVVAIGGPAISITAPGLAIALRNLVIVPLPGGGATFGVHMTGASSLTIDGSLIANLPSFGVYAVGAGARVAITNSVIRNVGEYAVQVQNGAFADVSGTKMLNNIGGVSTRSDTVTTTKATVSDSIISGYTYGVNSFVTIAGGIARVFVTRCTIQGTTYPLLSETTGVGTAALTFSNSMITNNLYAWFQNGIGSSIYSLGNNHIADNNDSNGTGTLTQIGQQ